MSQSLSRNGRLVRSQMYRTLVQVACEPAALYPQGWVLLLDADGTTHPFVANPERARPGKDIRESLKELSQKYCMVAYISGQLANDLRSSVGVEGIHYVGIYGVEYLSPHDTAIVTMP